MAAEVARTSAGAVRAITPIHVAHRSARLTIWASPASADYTRGNGHCSLTLGVNGNRNLHPQ